MSDTTLVAINVALGLALTLLGVGSSIRPPKKPLYIGLFTAAFAVIGAATMWTSIIQSNRAAAGQVAAQQLIHRDQLESQAKISALQGRLDTVVDIVSSGSSSSTTTTRQISDLVQQFRSLSTLPNDALQGRAVDVERRIRDKLREFETTDIGFEDRLAYSHSEGETIRITQARNRMRAKFAADNKPLIAEATSVLSEMMNRMPLRQDAADLSEMINQLSGRGSPVPFAKNR